MDVVSKYRFLEFPNGFHIEGKDRNPVSVCLSQEKTSLLISEGPEEILQEQQCVALNLYAYQRLLATITDTLLIEWNWVNRYETGRRQWVRRKVLYALNSRVHHQWKRLLGQVPAIKQEIARKIFAVTFAAENTGCQQWEELYSHPYLLQDILHWRAAAIACQYAPLMVSDVGSRLTHFGGYVPQTELQAQIAAFYENYTWRSEQTNTKARKEVIAILAKDWKALFSHDAKPSRSLRRTLINLPGGIPARLLRQFMFADDLMHRPIIDRVELLTFLEFACNFRDVFSSTSYPEATLYEKASRKEILSALRLLAQHLRLELSPTSKDIANFVQFLQDYCQDDEVALVGPLKGNLVGLMKRAIDWKRKMRAREVEEQLARYRGREQVRTASPPLALPNDPCIQFLSSVKALKQEGLLMNHCIASFAAQAVEGQCYVFHISHMGEQATTQVDQQGEVLGSYGPNNSSNVASRYGQQILARWGKKLGKVQETKIEGHRNFL